MHRGKLEKLKWPGSRRIYFFSSAEGKLVCYVSKDTFVLEANMCASGGRDGRDTKRTGRRGEQDTNQIVFFLNIVPCPSLFPPVYLEDVWHQHHQYA